LNPAVRLSYPECPHRSNRQGIGVERKGEAPLGLVQAEEATEHLPGTPEKVREFIERARLGLSLFHPGDARDDGN